MNEELKVIISAEIAKLKTGIDNAKKEVGSFKSQVEKTAKEVDKSFADMGKGINTALKNCGTILLGFGTALLGTAAATEEYRENQAKLATAFETAGGSAATATTTYNDLYRVLGDGGQATEAAAHLAKLTTNEKDLSQWTNICKGVYATFGDSLPIEGLTEAANETAKTGKVTGVLADALNWAGISEDDFNAKLAECNTEAEREQLIRSTLNGTYADAAAAYEENNASVLAQRDSQAKLQEQLALLGAAMSPILTLFTTFATEVLTALAPHIQNLAETLLPILQTGLEAVGSAVSAAMGFIIDNWELFAAIAGVIGAISLAIGMYNTVAAVKAALDAAQVATVWQLAAAHLAAIAPYLLIVAAIAAVIAIVIVCIKYWDEIKAAAVKAWEWIKAAWKNAGVWFSGIVEKIKAAFAKIGTWFSNLFKNAWNGIKNAWSSVVTWFSNTYNKIKNVFASVGAWFKNIFTGAWNGIKTAWSSVKTWFSNLLTGIKTVWNTVGTFFKTIFTNAWNGVKAIWSGVGNFFRGVWNTIKSIFSNVGTAIANGIKGAVSGAVNKVLSAAVKIINGFISAINFAIGVINAIPGVNIRKLSALSVPAMAKGGVVDAATLAVIGEQGKEAVVPLENNLEWLDKLAGMLNDRLGGSSAKNIVMQVDGKTFAQISIDSINQLTAQTGALPLAIV